MSDLPELPPTAFERADETPDAVFYAAPRLVTHIDDAAIAAVTDAYRRLLPPGGTVLDLMSSWVSHLPQEVEYAAVVGHGMNAEELSVNPRLTRWFVQDLNQDPVLPLADHSLDAAAICVSIQYLKQPVAVLKDLARALRPGAPVVISFSNRCFPTKAVRIWQALDGEGHLQLIGLYLQRAGFTDVSAELAADGLMGDPLVVVSGRAL